MFFEVFILPTQVVGGQRIGVVARHLNRRVRVQRSAHSALGRATQAEELHGLQGRWYCLVKAPLLSIGEKTAKNNLATTVPGAISLVTVIKISHTSSFLDALGSSVV